MSEAVNEILDRIQRLPAEDRMVLEHYLAQQVGAEWQREADVAHGRPSGGGKAVD